MLLLTTWFNKKIKVIFISLVTSFLKDPSNLTCYKFIWHLIFLDLKRAYMFNSQRPREKYSTSRPVVPRHFHVVALKGYEFALARLPRFYHRHLDGGVWQLTYSNIAQLEHEAEFAVTFGYYGVVRENNGPFSLVGSRYFGEYHARYQTLHKNAETRLYHKKKDGKCAFFCYVA